jgi:hypothetical protein
MKYDDGTDQAQNILGIPPGLSDLYANEFTNFAFVSRATAQRKRNGIAMSNLRWESTESARGSEE